MRKKWMVIGAGVVLVASLAVAGMAAAHDSKSGATKVTVACALPAVALAPVGAPGTVKAGLGVTLLEAAEGAPVPTAFVAVTVNV